MLYYRLLIIYQIAICSTISLTQIYAQVSFGVPINVSNRPQTINLQPTIANDSISNCIHLAWICFSYDSLAPDNVSSDLYYTNNRSGNFADPIKIHANWGWYTWGPNIAIDKNGNVHIAFIRSTEQIRHTNDTAAAFYSNNLLGTFSTPSAIYPIWNPNEPLAYGVFREPYKAKIFFDTASNPFVICQGRWREPISGEFHTGLIYSTLLNGIWTAPTPIRIPQVGFSGLPFSGQIGYCVDVKGYVHIVFKDPFKNWKVFLYTNNVFGTFSEPDTLFDDKEGSNWDPDISVDKNGITHVVCSSNVYPVTYLNNNTGAFQIVSQTTGQYANLDLKNGFVHIGGQISYYSGEIFYGSNETGQFQYTSNKIKIYDWSFYPPCRFFCLDNSSNAHFVFYGSESPGTNYQIFYLQVSHVTTVEQINSEIPKTYCLYQNYPNPFNPITTIEFSIPKQSQVILTIYNALGIEIDILVKESLPQGKYKIQWVPKNISSGVYFCQLRSSEFTDTKKILLLR